MNNPVEHLFCVTDSQGETHGVVFFVSHRVALTCYLVIDDCGAESGGYVGLMREGDKQHEIYQALGDDIKALVILNTHRQIPPIDAHDQLRLFGQHRSHRFG
jgi:hypothetical protein